MTIGFEPAIQSKPWLVNLYNNDILFQINEFMKREKGNEHTFFNGSSAKESRITLSNAIAPNDHLFAIFLFVWPIAEQFFQV